MSVEENTEKESETIERKGSRRKAKKAKAKRGPDKKARTRTPKPYPTASFEEVLVLAEAIQKFASGEKVRRLTLLKQMDLSPTSSATRMLIINSNKYGLTIGNYNADFLELTALGKIASSSEANSKDITTARFNLAISRTPAFEKLYSEYKGKKIPTHDVLKDLLTDSNFEIENLDECIDLFIVNAKYLNILQTIAGSETLVSIEQVLDELNQGVSASGARREASFEAPKGTPSIGTGKKDWSKMCFVITPIGEPDSDQRKHADLFLSSLIEPALKGFDLEIVRADMIGSPGMITSQILEHLMRCRLAIADLSFHNPNAFYEMAIRHACKLPIVQIIRTKDKIPFDVNQIRTVVIDTTDIYSLVPKLETYRSEIATQVRAALGDGSIPSNPLTVFFPGFQVVVPKE